MGGFQAVGSAGIARHERWDLFCKGAALARLNIAIEATNRQPPARPVLAAGQISNRAWALAMHMRGGLLAVWAEVFGLSKAKV